MKKIIAILLGIELLIIAGIFGFEFQDKKIPTELIIENTNEDKLGATILYPYQGGTGTSTAPTYGQMLVGNSGGTYTLTATSSLGITAAGDGASNWLKQINYGVLNLTASTTIPYWAKDAFYASSTSIFQGLATFGNASTTQISATNSYVGTVLSGIWNGTALGNAYVDDDITLTNITQITNRAISDTTGTLTVARGGTGQTSFGQGWLHSDGTTFTSSTSPTFNYIYATSTTATSTFPYLSVTTNSNLGTIVGGTWQGTAIGDAYLTKSGDWTGTIDSNNFAGGAIGAGELIYGGSAGSFSELALGTNGFVLALAGGIPSWVATTTLSTISGTLDISSQSNLTCGTNCTLTGDDISVDDAFLLNNGDVGTGVYDFGGATSLEVPNNGTVNANGEITTDDTSGQLRYYAGSTERVLVPIWSRGFTYATSSAWSATTTKPYSGQAPYDLTITTAFCETDTGTLNVSVRDGAGNRLDLINASTTIGTFTFSTNNTFTKGESIRVEAGTPATSPTLVSCTFIGTPTAD